MENLTRNTAITLAVLLPALGIVGAARAESAPPAVSTPTPTAALVDCNTSWEKITYHRDPNSTVDQSAFGMATRRGFRDNLESFYAQMQERAQAGNVPKCRAVPRDDKNRPIFHEGDVFYLPPARFAESSLIRNTPVVGRTPEPTVNSQVKQTLTPTSTATPDFMRDRVDPLVIGGLIIAGVFFFVVMPAAGFIGRFHTQ